MTDAAQLLLSRLEDPRSIGRDRWRAACPVCGGKNRSTLSIGIGDTGCVLLKCWKDGCGPDAIAAAVGLDLEDLFPPKESHGRSPKRRRLLPASQALDLLHEEATFLWIVASDWVRGKAPDPATLERVITSVAYIGAVRDEVNA